MDGECSEQYEYFRNSSRASGIRTPAVMWDFCGGLPDMLLLPKPRDLHPFTVRLRSYHARVFVQVLESTEASWPEKLSASCALLCHMGAVRKQQEQCQAMPSAWPRQ